MHLRHLSLTNFRLYSRLEVDLPSQAILLYGDNAQGKTSLLEAIYVLATGRSAHTTSDRQLINWLASEEGLTPHARLAADVVRVDRSLHIDMVLMLEPAKTEDGWRFRKQIKVNGAVVRTTDLIGQIAVVMFLPDDVEIVSGSPAQRRRYLDNALAQVDVDYARALDLYGEVLSQRNALLRQLAETGGTPIYGADQLFYWDEQLAAAGTTITLKRQSMIAELEQLADRLHRDLTHERHTLRLRYQPAFNADQPIGPVYQRSLSLDLPTQSPEATFEQARKSFLKQLTAKRSEELARGTHVGRAASRRTALHRRRNRSGDLRIARAAAHGDPRVEVSGNALDAREDQRLAHPVAGRSDGRTRRQTARLPAQSDQRRESSHS